MSIQPFVNIGPNVVIGDNVHIFSQAMIGHNTKLENFSYINGANFYNLPVNTDKITLSIFPPLSKMLLITAKIVE